MTHQHNSNGREWLMVFMPEGAVYQLSVNNTILYQYRAEFTPSAPSYQIDLPSDTWRIHSDSLTITEEQAGEIVEKDEAGWYKGYEQSGDYQVLSSTSAVKSYRSLLRSLNINSRVINLVRI